jgi:Ca-activated chloride channel family protein
MTFAWPWMLASLAAIPLLVLAHRRLLRQRVARRAELAALGLVSAGAVSTGRRRQVGPVLFLTAMAVLFVALARPAATISQAHREGTVVLAFDVSGSMAATDLAPSRIAAAKSAARAFVAREPAAVRIGVVAFSASGLVTQQPTKDRSRVLSAIAQLTPKGGTALARGLQTSLSAIAGKTVLVGAPGDAVEPRGQDLGFHGSAAVILLSDGENTAGPDPLDVADLASTAGVKIYPIGLGSPVGTVLDIDGFQVATALDEPLLREMAAKTGGRYFAASDAAALTKVYTSIDLAWVLEPRHVEVTALFAAAAALLLLVGAGLSLAWYGRVV